MRPGPEITALRQLFGEIVDEPTVAKHLADTMSGGILRYPT